MVLVLSRPHFSEQKKALLDLKKFGDKFMFRGKWYLDEMYNDARRMPELSHAMGAVSQNQSELSKVYNAVEGSPSSNSKKFTHHYHPPNNHFHPIFGGFHLSIMV